MTAEQIKTAALKLDPVEKEALAEELLLSIAESDREAIDAAWLAEVRCREEAFAAGTSQAKPVEEFPSHHHRRYASEPESQDVAQANLTC